ncbi:hypothetical protein ACFWBG_30270 [Nocardia salmonicida]|uniref:hypothetical protein n=1 Tax=Nocardia salmonicida TaxID=53431 RepID=UPI00366D4E32
MQLMIDPERNIDSAVCDCCDTPYDRVNGFINTENGAYAIYYASCLHHQGTHEAYIDVIFDNCWDPDDPVNNPSSDRVTFGCRVGPAEGHTSNTCSLVPAASVAPNTAFYGQKLEPDQARQHPWLSLYWDTIDHILEHDATVSAHLHRS